MTTKRGETAAILPSEIKGRKRPMTDAEFVALLADGPIETDGPGADRSDLEEQEHPGNGGAGMNAAIGDWIAPAVSACAWAVFALCERVGRRKGTK